LPRKPIQGDIVRIDFDEDRHTFAQILADSPYVAVYDSATAADKVATMAEVVGQPILFIVAATVSRGWPVVGKAPPGSPEVEVPEYFMQDIVNPQQCQIVDAKGSMRRASPEECRGLEVAAVWDPEHITERIRDHYAGRPNWNLESSKLRL
jgi:hypothetical protein